MADIRVLAGLAWGTTVPLIFYGGNELGGRAGRRSMAILCVGVAYFFSPSSFRSFYCLPSVVRNSGRRLKTTGLVFAGAGRSGWLPVGALCVIFASKSATQVVLAATLNPATYRMYIAPLIFGVAPVINTLLSRPGTPKQGEPFPL